MTTNTRARKAAAATATATANVTARKAAAAKKVAPAHVTKQAAEVKAMKPAPKKAAEKKVLKKEQTFEQRDWTYLDEKDPSEQHVILAKEINRRTNLEEPISAKHVQAVLAMFPHFQRSETNKSRSGYHGLDEVIVEQRSVHMVQAHKDAARIMDELAAKANSKAVKKVTAKKTTPVRKANPAGAAKAVAKKAAADLNHTAAGTDTKPASLTKKAAPARRRTATKTAAPVPSSMDSSNEAF